MKAVLGMGNALKQDDNIGNMIATQLQNRIHGAKIFVAGTAPESFLYQIQKLNPSVLYIIDAADFEGEVGEVRLLSLEDVTERKASTHNVPVSFFEKYAGETKVIGIKVQSTAFGMGLTSEMKGKFQIILKKVAELVN